MESLLGWKGNNMNDLQCDWCPCITDGNELSEVEDIDTNETFLLCQECMEDYVEDYVEDQ